MTPPEGLKEEPAKTTGRPLRADAERNRQRLLTAAQEVFARRGLTATLDDIASYAGVGVGTVYRRYANKQELIEALFVMRIEAIAAMAEQALTDPDPWHGMTSFMHQVCEATARDKGMREILFHGRTGHNQVATARDRIVPLTTALVSRAQASGHLRPDLEPMDFPLIMTMMEAVIEFTSATEPELWQRFLTLMLSGMRTAQVPASALPGHAMTLENFETAMQRPTFRPAR
jgi:AcrR family transcriptional regulator